jgi:hypothetical protein
MIKFAPLIISFCFPEHSPDLYLPKRHSESIPYESLYEIQKPNKNIMEYNTMSMEELVREQTEKIMGDLFNKGSL